MTEAGERLLEGAREMAAVARGEQPAARIWQISFAYVPEQQWQPIETSARDGSKFNVWDVGYELPVVMYYAKIVN